MFFSSFYIIYYYSHTYSGCKDRGFFLINKGLRNFLQILYLLNRQASTFHYPSFATSNKTIALQIRTNDRN